VPNTAQTPSTARSAGKQQQQPIAAAPTRKERKEAFLAQLPLKEGRPVAFKPPVKGSGKGAKSDPGSTDWILTRVVRCISGDKNRYEVQDVQDEQGIEGKPGA
jgi:SAGA-associated factor 29